MEDLDEAFVQYMGLDNDSKEFHGAYDGVMHLVVLFREGMDGVCILRYLRRISRQRDFYDRSTTGDEACDHSLQ